MTDFRNNRGHSRKLKIGVGGQPVVSHDYFVRFISLFCFDSKNFKSGVNSRIFVRSKVGRMKSNYSLQVP